MRQQPRFARVVVALVQALLSAVHDHQPTPSATLLPPSVDLLQQAYLVGPTRIPEVTALLTDIIVNPDRPLKVPHVPNPH